MSSNNRQRTWVVRPLIAAATILFGLAVFISVAQAEEPTVDVAGTWEFGPTTFLGQLAAAQGFVLEQKGNKISGSVLGTGKGIAGSISGDFIELTREGGWYWWKGTVKGDYMSGDSREGTWDAKRVSKPEKPSVEVEKPLAKVQEPPVKPNEPAPKAGRPSIDVTGTWETSWVGEVLLTLKQIGNKVEGRIEKVGIPVADLTGSIRGTSIEITSSYLGGLEIRASLSEDTMKGEYQLTRGRSRPAYWHAKRLKGTPSDVTGKWAMIQGFGEFTEFELIQEGNKIHGTAVGQPITGSIRDNSIDLTYGDYFLSGTTLLAYMEGDWQHARAGKFGRWGAIAIRLTRPQKLSAKLADPSIDITGTWDVSLGGVFSLTQSGNEISGMGSVYYYGPVSGLITGNSVFLRQGSEFFAISYAGSVDGDEMKGLWLGGGGEKKGEWTATRR